MAEDRNSYKSIVKSIGLFGGVSVFQILISIVKNKFIAILLGPTGMGISGMITSSTSLISSLTGFGLRTSSVREVSQAYASNDIGHINRTATVLRKLVLFTGLLGTIVVFSLAKQLSVWSFGNEDFTIAFRIVSVILLIDQLCIGQTVFMQGTFHYKYMAKASLIGSVIGLVISIPLYYIWKIDAIVPVIIISSLTSLLLSWIYSRKIPIEKVPMTMKQTLQEGKVMLSLGIVIALTGVINSGQVFILRMYISNYGNIEDVGLYIAGTAIATSYIGVIFSAMGTDYSPRLAAIANNNEKLLQVINRQIVLLITLITPLIIIFIVFIKQLTILLYSTKFIAITGMIEWIMFGMFFRAISWSLSFALVAKAETKVFFWNELISSFYSLAFSILGYKLYGFAGMGVAFYLTYVCFAIQMYVLFHKRYNFRFSSDIAKTVLPQIAISIVIFVLLKLFGDGTLRYIIGCIGIIIVSYLSYSQLDKLLDINTVLVSLKNKLKTKNDNSE